jgi:hypothetical protein
MGSVAWQTPEWARRLGEFLDLVGRLRERVKTAAYLVAGASILIALFVIASGGVIWALLQRLGIARTRLRTLPEHAETIGPPVC